MFYFFDQAYDPFIKHTSYKYPTGLESVANRKRSRAQKDRIK